MYRLLLIDGNAVRAERLATCFRRRRLLVTIAASLEDAMCSLRRKLPAYEIVVLVAPGKAEQGLAILRKLKHACRQTWLFHRPLFLFVSGQKCNPHLRLRIERMGARYFSPH
jgi:ActR/RegA family two-component response regulator